MKKRATTWGSNNAEDMYKIATCLAGFNARELMLEINKIQHNRESKVNLSTVLNAMQNIADRKLN